MPLVEWLRRRLPRAHLRARDGVLVDPVLAHIHVPKCAGTALRNFLIQHFGPSHLALYVPDTFHVYPEAELAGILADRSIRGFSSHFVRTFPPRLAGRDLLYITFLRDPVDQFISYVTYVKKNYQYLQDDRSLIASLPPNLTAMSVRDIAQWILTCDRHVNFHENFTVNFFARYSVPGDAGPFRIDADYRRKRLATAKQILRRFLFVGVSEQMDRSIAVLRKLLERRGLSFPAGDVPLDNTSHEFRGNLDWLHETDKVGALLLASIREDQQLYEWARVRMRRLEAS